MTYRILDSKGSGLSAGALVTDFDGDPGTVTWLGEDEGRIVVAVDWPCPGSAHAIHERYQATPWDYRREGPDPTNWCVPDLVVTDRKEHLR